MLVILLKHRRIGRNVWKVENKIVEKRLRKNWNKVENSANPKRDQEGHYVQYILILFTSLPFCLGLYKN